MDSAIKRTIVLAEDEKSARDFVHFMELKKKILNFEEWQLSASIPSKVNTVERPNKSF